MSTVNCPLTDLPGISDKRAKAFARLGLHTLEDFPMYFPRDYEDRTRFCTVADAPFGESVCITATVAREPTFAQIRQGLSISKVTVFDKTGELLLTFFNAAYVHNALLKGKTYVFYGKVESYNGQPQMTNPLFEHEGKQKDNGSILPVYPSTAGLPQSIIRSAMRRALAEPQPEILSAQTLQRQDLIGRSAAFQNIHFPDDFEGVTAARRRFCFEELLLVSLGLARRKQQHLTARGIFFEDINWVPFADSLPFKLTKGQNLAIADIVEDFGEERQMNRLIQGDVGCGKTVVAAAAAYIAAKNGYQTALMAPTEILAEQHARDLAAFLAPFGFAVGLVTAKGKAAARRAVRDALAAGEIDVAVGTHALLNSTFARLGVVIVDEQHRFGVEQRERLSKTSVAQAADSTPCNHPSHAALSDRLVADCRGVNEGNKSPHSPTPIRTVASDGTAQAHVLVLSATPIPQTLARIFYGDLELSVIRELPPGRQPVKTYVVGEGARSRIWNFVRTIHAEGGQTFIVCPAIEDNPDSDIQSAEILEKHLRETVFPDLRVGLLHGKVKQDTRDTVMRAFAVGELDVLVATTVIEVGIHIPGARLMIVENAERFGLSQLHQLRGRVGRGGDEAHCVLFLQSASEVSKQRMRIMRDHNDGFSIAEADLDLRGPGDFFGNRQHGLPVFRAADLFAEPTLPDEARVEAELLLSEDPNLDLSPNLRDAVEDLMRRAEEE